MDHILLIHSSIDRYLGCFYLLPIVNSAAMYTHYMFLFEHLFSILLESRHRGGIADSYDNSMFSFLRKIKITLSNTFI